jgi:hypothetical protein
MIAPSLDVTRHWGEKVPLTLTGIDAIFPADMRVIHLHVWLPEQIITI